jgi:hypothetical protein
VCKGGGFRRTKSQHNKRQHSHHKAIKDLLIGALHSDLSKEKLREKLFIANKEIVFKLDTRADANVLPESILNEIQPQMETNLKKTSHVLTSFEGNKIKPLGKIFLHTFCPVTRQELDTEFSKLPALKQTLENLEKQGVIADVDKPTEWVHNLVITEKKNGSLRVCLDPKPLN